ncbi:FYDLN acid domain-containing protein [Kiloniella sp. b19]|uniref:FYDLN acid domain-containing protein n=1 Tax=Kiloniella sp. GXU_MW_B19 TaxID=3141326 RepID=UPI0031D2AF00
MSKPEWGSKHHCEQCGAKFYDFLKFPVVCPKCDTEADVSVAHLEELVVQDMLKNGEIRLEDPVETPETEAAEGEQKLDDFPNDEELDHIDDGPELEISEDEFGEALESAHEHEEAY